jgi:hypothetical protein
MAKFHRLSHFTDFGDSRRPQPPSARGNSLWTPLSACAMPIAKRQHRVPWLMAGIYMNLMRLDCV